MIEKYFFQDRENELRALVGRLNHSALEGAACRGLPPDVYHPEVGQPDQAALACCQLCPARLSCLALALQTEPSDARYGWYGGLGPRDRDNIAARLDLVPSETQLDERAKDAIRLRCEGHTLNEIAERLGCCRRTVQRYLRTAA